MNKREGETLPFPVQRTHLGAHAGEGAGRTARGDGYLIDFSKTINSEKSRYC